MMINTVNDKPEAIKKPVKLRTTVNLDEEVMEMIPFVTPNLSEFVRDEIRRKYNRAVRRATQEAELRRAAREQKGN